MYYSIGGCLCHHGIQGQKWGKRNGPPYPLKPGDHSAAEKKAAGGKKSSGEDKTKTIKKSSTKKPKEGMSAVLAYLAFLGGVNIASMGVIAAAAAGHKAIVKHNIKKYGKEKENEEVDPKTGLKLKNKEMTDKQDLKRVNPEHSFYSEESKGSINNCVRCTAAYELRRRGYDVSAAKADKGTNGEEFMKKLFGAKDAKGVPGYDKYPPSNELIHFAKMGGNKSAVKATRKALSKEPPGSRGQMLSQWDEYSGHSYIYQITDKGKVEILDAQSGRKMNKAAADSYLAHSCYIRYQRLDNCNTINKFMLKEAVNDYPDASKKKSGK